MNTLLRSFLFASLLSASAVVASSQVQPSPATITVSGSAEIKVAPDEAVLNVGVETRDPSLPGAQRENDERSARALKFLRENGVTDADLRTDYVQIQTIYDYNKSRTTEEGYVAKKGIEVRIRKLENFERILAGLLANGVNRVNGVIFRSSELRRHRDQARQMAIRAAREKADALAAELGVRRGKVHQISETATNGWNGYNGTQSNSLGFGSGPSFESSEGAVALGQISVSASVSVTFLLE